MTELTSEEFTGIDQFAKQYEQMRQRLAKHFGITDPKFRVKSRTLTLEAFLNGDWVRLGRFTVSEMEWRATTNTRHRLTVKIPE